MVHADPGIPCLVGNRVTVGHRVILHGCVVEDECLIGMVAILLNRVKVGTGSVVGAELLLEGMEISPGSLVVGSPAKVVRQVEEKARARIDRIWRHYVEQANHHRAGSLPSYPPVPQPADSSQRASRSVGKRLIDPAHRMARLRKSTGAQSDPRQSR